MFSKHFILVFCCPWHRNKTTQWTTQYMTRLESAWIYYYYYVYYMFCYSKKMISKIIMFTSEKKWMPNGRKRRKFLKSYIFCISLCLFSIPFKLHHLHVILYIHIHVHTYIYIIHTYAHVHNHIHIHVHIYIHISIQCTYAHTYTILYMHIHICYICMHIHICTHSYIPIYMLITQYILTHFYVVMWSASWPLC